MEEKTEGAVDLMYDTADVEASPYKNLSDKRLAMVNNLWEELKSDIDVSPTIYVICAVIVAAMLFSVIFFAVRKKKRNGY